MTEPATTDQQANRLIDETSPYLIQHAHNPVDWYPWGAEALARAQAEDRPILLSVGYSACHWCHVMAHESFEDPQTAALMNQWFVNVKVDREERPDIDAMYMDAVQAMTGQGGWPMTVFLTPAGKPFYGGTYFPPSPRHGLPSFQQVLRAIADAWENRRPELLAAGERVTEALRQSTRVEVPGTALTPDLLERATQALLQGLDREHGGFGQAPKFPQPMVLDFLAQRFLHNQDQAVLNALVLTLTRMAQGGIYDHLGGGFHRYSTDASWLVPHFEKMLYDNAQLASTYLHAWQITRDDLFRRVVEETLDYVLREMTSVEGAFYSTQDADSEGQEGKYYVWTTDEVEQVLGAEDARLFSAYYGLRREGNFHEGGSGQNILHVGEDIDAVARGLGIDRGRVLEAVLRGRQLLLAQRGTRVAPGRDDKVLAEWNGLMVRALAEAGAAFERDDYVQAARRGGEFILERLATTTNDESLLVYRTYREGTAHLNGYLEDYTAVGLAFLALYEATLDPKWLQQAVAIPPILLHRFFDAAAGGFFQTTPEHEELLARRKDFMDNALPSGNSMAAELLLRLGKLLDREDYAGYAGGILQLMSEAMAAHPTAFGRLLCALDFYLHPGYEIAIIGEPAAPATRSLLGQVWERYLPNSVLAGCAPGDEAAAGLVPFLADRPQVDGKPTAYVCRNYTCQLPVTEAAALAGQLQS